jgi:hypothetical protein
MIINFKEIPPANKGGGHQDAFELFAREFLEALGYKIERPPDRGPDGKKDMIVSEIQKGIVSETKISWLVSCKHKIHSGKAVTDTDEPDIMDRILNHSCNGFIGFYSTLPSSSLTNKLHNLKIQKKIEYHIFDNSKIEKILLEKKHFHLFSQYFTNSFIKYKETFGAEKTNFKNDSITQKKIASSFSTDDLIQITSTAISLIDIEKIKEDFFSNKKQWDHEILYKLNKYLRYDDGKISTEIFSFLSDIAEQTRGGMPSRIAGSIFSLVLTFFPPRLSHNKNNTIEHGNRCIYIGYALIYDSLIHSNNLLIAEYGLSIWKYIYRHSNKYKLSQLSEEVLKKYSDIEETLHRPERDDLENARELVKIFKDDLNEWDLSFPILPERLQKLANIKED